MLDQNSGGTVTSASSLGGSYSIDACGTGTGHAQHSGHSYVFYMVASGNAVIQETTSGVVAHGSLVQPQGGPFTAASLRRQLCAQSGGTRMPRVSGERRRFCGTAHSPTAAGNGDVRFARYQQFWHDTNGRGGNRHVHLRLRRTAVPRCSYIPHETSCCIL